MPIFEYTCNDCNHPFEALVMGKEKAACPKCNCKNLASQLSVFAVQAKGPTRSSTPSGGCGTCGDPRGPGSCTLPD